MTVQGSGSVGLPRKSARIPADGHFEVVLGCERSSHAETGTTTGPVGLSTTVTTTQYQVQRVGLVLPAQGTQTYGVRCGACGATTTITVRSHPAAAKRRARVAVVCAVLLLASVFLAIIMPQPPPPLALLVYLTGVIATVWLLISAFPSHWYSIGGSTDVSDAIPGHPHKLLYEAKKKSR